MQSPPLSCWVVLRCGSSRIAGKVVGGPRAKYNEGIPGSAFCLSISPAAPLASPLRAVHDMTPTLCFQKGKRQAYTCPLYSPVVRQGRVLPFGRGRRRAPRGERVAAARGPGRELGTGLRAGPPSPVLPSRQAAAGNSWAM